VYFGDCAHEALVRASARIVAAKFLRGGGTRTLAFFIGFSWHGSTALLPPGSTAAGSPDFGRSGIERALPVEGTILPPTPTSL
jgi:hypothetical protein